MKSFIRSLQAARTSTVFWLVTFASLLLLLLLLPRSPLPWLDEMLFASASLSMVRGGPAIPTVMGAFPHTARFDLFYGPLMFVIGAIDVKWFGLSATAWRFLGFIGAVGTVFSAAWVSRCLDRSRTAIAASAMFVVLSQGMGARATSGRLDTVTVLFELLALACALRSLNTHTQRWSALLYAGTAGIFCGMAALTTPRAFPFLFGLGVAMCVETVLARSQEFLLRSLIVGVVALLPVWAWTYQEGLSPLGWFRYILAATRGDKVSASPMLHGSWHLFDEPLVPLVSGFLAILLTLIVFGAAALTGSRSRQSEDDEFVSSIRLASIAVLINYGATFLTIARFWDYEIFVVPLVLPVLAPLSARILRSTRLRVIRFGVLAVWVVLAVFLIPIRAGKIAIWLASYSERDPRPLETFVVNNVPQNSIVLGPESDYFYAVEAAGSHYLIVHPKIPWGLLSPLDQGPNWREQLKTGLPVYVLWPGSSGLLREFPGAALHLEASVSFQAKEGRPWWNRTGWAYGYSPTNLYRISDTTEQDSK